MNWLAQPLLPIILTSTMKITVILLVCWTTGHVSSKLSAAHRHRIWTVGILASLMLPIFSVMTPQRYSVPIAGVIRRAQPWVPGAALQGVAPNVPSTVVFNRLRSKAMYTSLTTLAISIWAIGAFLVTLKLLVAFIRLSRMSACSGQVQEEWGRLVTEISKSLHVLCPVRTFQSDRRGVTPLTWGIFRPRIILPHGSSEWPEERRRIVLAHELAHIGRQDWFLQMCAELLRCFFWFHPLVWVAAAGLRQESEQACDDVVLNYGIEAPDYANELLAQTIEISGRSWQIAPAMARPSSLEKRLNAMLSQTINRSPLSRMAKLVITSIAVCLLLPLVALRAPAQNQLGKPAVPHGWILAGSNPTNYVTGVDPPGVSGGSPIAYLKSVQYAGVGFGTLMQQFDAAQYAGKRLRVSASVKADQVKDWAGLWMRVDRGSESVAFDNMEDRRIKGTTGWQDYQVVLDAPKDATGVALGLLLSQSGTVWLRRVKFEVVGRDVPTTGRAKPSLPVGPANLNFEN